MPRTNTESNILKNRRSKTGELAHLKPVDEMTKSESSEFDSFLGD